mmetsp:Transcript_41891/g.98198  ORF Transcript_41891/g.98198 Transcript_41891/m.98198 type:complete len:226 (-) Transcript_41891:1014-1691(-)
MEGTPPTAVSSCETKNSSQTQQQAEQSPPTSARVRPCPEQSTAAKLSEQASCCCENALAATLTRSQRAWVQRHQAQEGQPVWSSPGLPRRALCFAAPLRARRRELLVKQASQTLPFLLCQTGSVRRCGGEGLCMPLATNGRKWESPPAAQAADSTLPCSRTFGPASPFLGEVVEPLAAVSAVDLAAVVVAAAAAAAALVCSANGRSSPPVSTVNSQCSAAPRLRR